MVWYSIDWIELWQRALNDHFPILSFFVVVAVNVDYTMVIVLAAAVVVVRSIAGWFFFSFFFPIGSTFWIDIGCDFSSGSLAIFFCFHWSGWIVQNNICWILKTTQWSENKNFVVADRMLLNYHLMKWKPTHTNIIFQ